MPEDGHVFDPWQHFLQELQLLVTQFGDLIADPGDMASRMPNVWREERTTPIGVLTAPERDRLNRFSAQMPDNDLCAFFQSSEADHTAINQQREDHTRLGLALQLCALRYLGCTPDDLRPPQRAAIIHVARQLDIPPEALAPYGCRIPTRTMHL